MGRWLWLRLGRKLPAAAEPEYPNISLRYVSVDDLVGIKLLPPHHACKAPAASEQTAWDEDVCADGLLDISHDKAISFECLTSRLGLDSLRTHSERTTLSASADCRVWSARHGNLRTASTGGQP